VGCGIGVPFRLLPGPLARRQAVRTRLNRTSVDRLCVVIDAPSPGSKRLHLETSDEP
jgi:hypothetical protein